MARGNALPTHLGRTVRERRSSLGLTQAALAERSGVSTEMVSRIERGKCLPSVPTLLAFARALGCSPNDLLGYNAGRHGRELDELLAVLRELPVARRRDIRRIAEALARYERR